MSKLELLSARIDQANITVGIFGLGYVGLPLALCFARAGIKVIGFDIDLSKVSFLNEGKSYIHNISSASVLDALEKKFEATSDFSRVSEADALIICVPTPLTIGSEPDLSYVINVVERILPHFCEGQLLSLESTTWPGTTDEVLAPRLKAAGFIPGQNCALVFSPEREDPGNLTYTANNIPKVIGGFTPTCLKLGGALYKLAINEVVSVSNTRIAEMSKLFENIHRAVNIGLVNEMKMIADKMDIDIHEVISAAATKPFGFVAYKPGPGVGGHCIPIDPFYLTWKAREFGIGTRFIDLAGEINRYMPSWVVLKTMDELGKRQKTLKGSLVLVLGVAYKKNVDDFRESPSVEILFQLIEKGARVHYSDPYIPHISHIKNHALNLSSIELNIENVKVYDCIILSTDHDVFDYGFILKYAALLIDTRGKFDKASNVVSA
ncbi:nucleotide sugar dehydrogenase [Pseudomonas poae]|uniref:nucleotide sugar dehydrogenase n=1 Tax=Pseudomonas poae TaxID=200451 RepID=UPI0030D49758